MRVLQILSYIFYDVCGIACFTMLLKMIFDFPLRKKQAAIGIGVAAFCISCANAVLTVMNIPDGIYGANPSEEIYESYLLFNEIQMLISNLLILIVPQIMLKAKKYLRNSLIILSLDFAADGLFSIISIIFDLNQDGPEKDLILTVYEIAVSLAMIAVLFFTGRNKNLSPVKNTIDTIPKFVYPLFIVFTFTAYCKEGLFDGGLENEIAEKIYDVFWMISLLGIIVLLAYFVIKIFSLTYQQTQIMKQLSDQHDNYEKMLTSDEKLREFRHDYKNHMLVVTALLNAGKTEEASEYLEKIKVQSGIVGRQFSTGNFVADAILNNKNSLAEEFAIHISFSGMIPSEGISDSDLCTVFANYMDNAIEGTKKYDGSRYINVESNVRNGFFVLSVTNPVNHKIEIKNNRIQTTKTDTKNHGIGLKNVGKIAEKYHGQMLLSCTDTEFTADVNLKLEHN